jgi:hypothetical protein
MCLLFEFNRSPTKIIRKAINEREWIQLDGEAEGESQMPT